MKMIISALVFLISILLSGIGMAALSVGVGKFDITPPIGSPSAGYVDRRGEGMQGVHDPLLAVALFIDNGEKKLAFCSVDHLGFSYDMVQEVAKQVHSYPGLSECEVYIASSHTHSGGGGYLNIPFLGEALAGPYSSRLAAFYVDNTAQAIIQASQHLIPAKIGIGYGKAEALSKYRGLWPLEGLASSSLGISPLADVAVVKFTREDETPLAVLFNYPMHPTVLNSQNRLFSSDFVGYARCHLKAFFGEELEPIYFNGAQGDIIPFIPNPDDRFLSCDFLGRSLAETVKKAYDTIEVSDSVEISSRRETYQFKPQPTPSGLALPLDSYKSEMNVVVFNKSHAFLTIPGELSCIYDQDLKNLGKELGYDHVSILGLVNDAHGYIILPEAWRRKAFESNFSFGGEDYGDFIREKAISLLKLEASLQVNN